MDTYEFDILEKKIVTDCSLHPTDVLKSDCPWLYAINNKYENVDPKKIGKWMLFVPKTRVNAVWDKIKEAVANADLWHTKVSTTDHKKSPYAIMIYTKDYTDLIDVIHTLDYLERSGIKSAKVTIHYKTDEQTYAGIYRGGRQKPWIYSSTTIRKTVASSN